MGQTRAAQEETAERSGRLPRPEQSCAAAGQGAQAARTQKTGADGVGRMGGATIGADGQHGAALYGQSMHIPPASGRASQANAAVTALSSVGMMLGAGAIANALVRAARWCFRGWAGARGAIRGEGEVTTERGAQGG